MNPIVVLRNIEHAVPGFEGYARSDANLFPLDTVCGLFAACSHFVRECEVAAECWAKLATLINDAASSVDKELANAACTCFIENIAKRAHPLAALLRGEALRHWNLWQDAG